MEKKQRVMVDGVVQKGIVDGAFVELQASSGKHHFVVGMEN